MDDGIGIAEAGAEFLAEVDVTDLAVGQGIHEAKLVDIDGHATRRLSHAEMIEAVEGVGPELDTGADLAEAAGFLEDLRGNALLGKCQRRCQSADAAAGDEDPIWAHR